ncbi:hypothetical protein [Pelagibacterium mangrovi]|uniref:hypothetical protein n=1 Tax=Pelagibacterium mangrovi TaxID=3119828 RepID=UPI003F807E25
MGGETIPAGPGAMLFGPRGIPHHYSVRRGPARMRFFLTPAALKSSCARAATRRLPIR